MPRHWDVDLILGAGGRSAAVNDMAVQIRELRRLLESKMWPTPNPDTQGHGPCALLTYAV